MKRPVLFLFICAFAALPALAQQDFSKVEIKAEPRVALPTVTFTRDTVFNVNGGSIRSSTARAAAAPRA